MDGDNPVTAFGMDAYESCRLRTTVHAEYTVVYNDGKSQIVKHVGKVRPDVGGAVFADAFGVEAVRLEVILRDGRGYEGRLTWVTALDSWFPLISCTLSG